MGSHTRKEAHGQALIGLLVAMALIAIVGAALMGQFKQGVYRDSIHRADMTACGFYTEQLRAAVMQYKQDNDGKNPPSLASLSKYGVVAEMYNAPGCVYGYDPNTGQLHPPNSMRPGDTAPGRSAEGEPAPSPSSAPAAAPGPGPQNPGNLPSTTVSGGGISVKVPTGGGNVDVNGGGQ